MIVLIKPTKVIRGERQVHIYNGRVQKIASLAAGLVTAKFLMELGQLCVGEGKGLDGLAQILPHFDCRIGQYDSWEEARALLMWRAYDCSVNGVSDAVYHSKDDGNAGQIKTEQRRDLEFGVVRFDTLRLALCRQAADTGSHPLADGHVQDHWNALPVVHPAPAPSQESRKEAMNKGKIEKAEWLW